MTSWSLKWTHSREKMFTSREFSKEAWTTAMQSERSISATLRLAERGIEHAPYRSRSVNTPCRLGQELDTVMVAILLAIRDTEQASQYISGLGQLVRSRSCSGAELARQDLLRISWPNLLVHWLACLVSDRQSPMNAEWLTSVLARGCAEKQATLLKRPDCQDWLCSARTQSSVVKTWLN